MAIAHETELMRGMEEAVAEARSKGDAVLFSHVKHISILSPLTFYHAGRHLYLGERSFWKSPDGTTLASLGSLQKFKSDSTEKRFINIEKQWRLFLERSIVQSEGISGTGPILFGGFSFDEQKSSSFVWDLFGDNLFCLPKFMLTEKSGQCYFTMNFLIRPETTIAELIKEVRIGEELCATAAPFTKIYSNSCTSQQEYDPDGWKKTVKDAVQVIKSTSIDKIVLARELRLKFEDTIMAEAVLENLLKYQDTSYVFSLESGRDCFIGASPERLVKKEGNQILSTCLAGSIGRGSTDEEDKHLGSKLLNDPKNLQEHRYVVEMIKQALGQEGLPVHVPETPVLMKTKDIQHLYTPVTARGNEGVSLFRLIAKLHPTPALGGLPKKEAVEWIRENEALERGLYAGPIGWIDSRGNGEFAVAIRSALLQGDEASLYAGCGIVEGSDPEEEYQETEIKFKPMLNALGGI